MSASALDIAVRELRRLGSPLLAAGDDPVRWARLLGRLGWDVADDLADDLGTLAQAVQAVDDTFAAIAEIDDATDLGALLDLLQTVGGAIGDLQDLPDDLAAAIATLSDATAREALAVDLIEFLILSYLARLSPPLYQFLRVVAVIRDTPTTEIVVGGRRLRSAIRRPHLALDQLGAFFEDPGGHLLSAHGIPAGLPDDAAAEAVVNGLLREVETLVHMLGGRALAGSRDAGAAAGSSAARSFSFAFAFQVPAGTTTLTPMAGATIEIVPASRATADGGAGPAVQVLPFGLIAASIPLGGWSVTIEAGGAPSTIIVDNAGLRAVGAGGQAKIGVALGRSQPLPPLGPSDGARLELGQPSTAGEVVIGADADIRLKLAIPDAKVVVQAGPGDGFLAKVLPSEGITIPFGFTLVWSRRNGVTFDGGVGLELRGAPNLTLFDVLRIDAYMVGVRVRPTGLRAEGTASIGLELGPLAMTLEQIGIGADFLFPSGAEAGGGRFGIAGPRGAGLAIEAGPVSGGGYLFFDPDKGEYAGILQLEIKVVSLVVIGLLNTKLPGGQPGFSLLLIITLELPPIQLGYGFTLNGVGGLLGINRTMVTEALREGARAGALGSIMFPKDPVANATRVLADLRAIFPPAEGRYTFGPMIKLGWGPNALIDIEVALILELPSPLRLAILGKFRIALPTKEEAVADLRLDVAGILDFALQEASVDAALVDSRLAVFTLTGEMAMRLGWGATKMFAVSAGGFNPRFTRPNNFPALRRIGIALATSDNPSIRLETYFALTANTLQLGAGAQIYAKADTVLGTFSVRAYVSFDAMVEFQPFHFIAELGAGVEIARNDVPFIFARLGATLEGPTPWQAAGYAEVEFLGRHRVAFEATIGEAVQIPARMVDLAQMLTDEVVRPDVWSALPPAGAIVASVRDAGSDAGVLIHPRGGVTLHQRVLPFAKRIARYGGAVPDTGPTVFELKRVSIGPPAGTPAPLFDDFSPGQYEALTDDEKLARPAFESMQAGGSATVAGFAVPAGAAPGAAPGQLVEPGFAELVVDNPAAPAQPLKTTGERSVETAVAARLRARPGSGFNHAGGGGVRVRPERYTVADADTLAPTAGSSGTSAAQAYDVLRDAGGYPGGGLEVVTVHELA